MENDDKKLDLALWRYGIISPLLHRDANDATLVEVLNALAEQKYIRPRDGDIANMSPETIRKWYYRYQQGGLKALEDKDRSDKGQQNVPDKIADEMIALRQEHPRWTLALILDRLVELELWDEKHPSRTVLYRFAKNNNLMRDPHLNKTEIVQPFSFEKFGQMWIADFMHGPKLWLGKKKKKAYLHVIIDDCTRYVVSGKFYPSESTEVLIKEMMTATRRYGIVQRFYTDNGASYNSRHLKIVCANLGISQPHTPAGKPQGRAKVERYFLTVRERFLAKEHYKSFDHINAAFELFLEDYHNRIHSTLKCSPMQKRLSVSSVCRKIPEVTDIEALFRLSRRCKVYQDGTIRLKKRNFEVPGCLPGSRVTISFMPWDLSRIYYGNDMRLAKPVALSENAHRFESPNFIKNKGEE